MFITVIRFACEYRELNEVFTLIFPCHLCLNDGVLAFPSPMNYDIGVGCARIDVASEKFFKKTFRNFLRNTTLASNTVILTIYVYVILIQGIA